MYINIDQTLVNLLHGLLNCEIGGLEYQVITTEYRTRVHCIHMLHLFSNALVHVIYSGLSGRCSYTITLTCKQMKTLKPFRNLLIRSIVSQDRFRLTHIPTH